VSAKRFSVILLITASVLAVGISFSQFSNVHGFSQVPDATVEQVTGEQESSRGLVPLKQLAVHSLSLPATFNLRTHVLTWFLFRTFVFTCVPETYAEEVSVTINPFFQRILALCISPNAP
jgi:hypothetical protein